MKLDRMNSLKRTHYCGELRDSNIGATVTVCGWVRTIRSSNAFGFVVLNDGQSGESLTQTDAVGKDTAVILLQLIDDSQTGIFLEIIELVPDLTFLEARGLIG